MKLGTFPSMTVSDARSKSLELKALASAGRDPVAELEDAQIKEAITRELAEAKGRRFAKTVDEHCAFIRRAGYGPVNLHNCCTTHMLARRAETGLSLRHA